MKFVVLLICPASSFSFLGPIHNIYSRILKNLKISAKKENKFRNTSEVMTLFCSVMPVTDRNRPYAGKDNDGNDYDYDDDDVAFI
jgi:hypothetical protein